MLKSVEAQGREFGWQLKESGVGVCRVYNGDLEEASDWLSAIRVSQRLDDHVYGELDAEMLYVQQVGNGRVVAGPFETIAEVPLTKMGFDGGHRVFSGAALLQQSRRMRVPPAEFAALGRSLKARDPGASEVDTVAELQLLVGDELLGLHPRAVKALLLAGPREREAMLELVHDVVMLSDGEPVPWLDGEPVVAPSAPQEDGGFDLVLSAAEDDELKALAKVFPYAKALCGALIPVEERVNASGDGCEKVYRVSAQGAHGACEVLLLDAAGLMAGASSALKRALRDFFSEASPVANQFVVSVTYEAWSPEAYEAGETDDKGVVVEKEVWDEDDLKQASRKYAFSVSNVPSPRTGSGPIWFASDYPVEDRELLEGDVKKFYQLHLSAVNGRAPTGFDYEYIADALGISFAQPLPIPSSGPESSEPNTLLM